MRQPSVTAVILGQHALPVEVLAASGRVDLDEYVEILFFDDVVDRARKRIAVYEDRLRVDLSGS
ncbi:hypothetical protein [Microvirga sp. KLBC 81]|uniref:hypothetical protein n=1 Tax=Microvirga sp. KLBC 81 TaxID=1862707 RepID=UPI00105768C6|nr:hypothetical protein [Microvirga sp. KLBC 81]